MHARSALPPYSAPCWPLLNSLRYCSLSVSSAHYLSCLTLPSFFSAVHFQIRFALNELFDANKPSQDFDEKEEPEQVCIPSELQTNCLLIDSSQPVSLPAAYVLRNTPAWDFFPGISAKVQMMICIVQIGLCFVIWFSFSIITHVKMSWYGAVVSELALSTHAVLLSGSRWLKMQFSSSFFFYHECMLHLIMSYKLFVFFTWLIQVS